MAPAQIAEWSWSRKGHDDNRTRSLEIISVSFRAREETSPRVIAAAGAVFRFCETIGGVDNIEKRGINLKSRTDVISERFISSSAGVIYPAGDIGGFACAEHN
jgi:hypothetical protein